MQFEVDGTDVAVGRVQAPGVVEAVDVVRPAPRHNLPDSPVRKCDTLKITRLFALPLLGLGRGKPARVAADTRCIRVLGWSRCAPGGHADVR